MAMNKNEIKKAAKENVLDLILDTLIDNGGRMVSDYEVGVPITIDGNEVVVVVSPVCKNWYDTKQAPAYDLDEVVEEYEADKEYKTKLKAESEKRKAEKSAKSKR